MASLREDRQPWHSSTATLCDRRDWAAAALRASVNNAEAGFRNSLRASAATHEWHLIRDKPKQDTTFDFMSWFREEIILLVPPFSLARLVSVRSISDSMNGDGIKQLLVELRAEYRVTTTLDGNHWLEGFQRLDRALDWSTNDRCETPIGHVVEYVPRAIRHLFLGTLLRASETR